MNGQNVLPVTVYQLGWRRGQSPAGVIWFSYRDATRGRDGSDYLEVNDPANLAAYAAVLSSGLPAYKVDDHISTDPSFARPGDYEVGTLRGDDVLISWSQLTWSRSEGGVILLHLETQQRYFLKVDDPSEFAALAATLSGPSPAYLRKEPETIWGKPESSRNL